MSDITTQMAAQIFSQEYELETDYAGVYYAAHAGYDVSEAVDFWRRMAVEHPGSIDFRGISHPSTAIRFLAIEGTVKEINEKETSELSIMPNLKERPDPKDKWR